MADWEKLKREKAKSVANVISAFTKSCEKCQAPSSKRRLFSLPEGLVCMNCAVLRDDQSMSVAEVIDAEAQYKEHLEKEANKPKPEGFGGWA